MIWFNQKDITNITRNKVEMIALYMGDTLLWEAPTGFIFTEDGFSILTSDGYIIKCKDQ